MPSLTHAVSPSDPYSRYSAEVGYNDLGILFKIFVERKGVILLTVIACILLALFYVSKMQVKYSAAAKFMVQTGASNYNGGVLETLLTNGRLDVADLLSQIQIMQSSDVLQQLVVAEKLYRDPEFGGDLEYDNYLDLPPAKQRLIIALLKQSLVIAPVAGTSIVSVSVETQDSIKSAAIANALVEAYSTVEMAKIRQEAQSATQWLADRLEVLREDVRQTAMDLEKAQEENNLSLSQTSDARLAKLDVLNKEMSIAEAQYAESLAVVEALEKAQADKKDLNSFIDIVPSGVLDRLRKQQADLDMQRSSLGQKYGPNHPEMKALKSEYRTFENTLSHEIENYLMSLRNKVDIQKAKIKGINERIAAYRESYRGDSEARLKVKTLQTQLDTSRKLLDNFMASYLEALQSLNREQKPIRIISPAFPNNQSNMPNKILIVVLSGVTGLFLGMFMALLVERLHDSVSSPMQLERLFNIRVSAILPRIKMPKGQSIYQYITDQAASPMAEMVRSLYTMLKLRDDAQGASSAKVYSVTSSHSGEGKTMLAAWLAQTAVGAGKRVILIDGDMRSPSMHQAFDIGNAKGLVDYLSDRLPLDEAIYQKHPSGLHIMTAKSVPTHALTLLGMDRMGAMVRRLRDMYDVIIIDSPTSLLYADARVLSHVSDQTLYIVEAKKTTREDLTLAVKMFDDADCDNLSFVLNKADDRYFIQYKG